MGCCGRFGEAESGFGFCISDFEESCLLLGLSRARYVANDASDGVLVGLASLASLLEWGPGVDDAGERKL